MGHDHHGLQDYVPKDHTIYKPEEIPHLVKLKERLAKQNLKDPWMRNEVYRYYGQEVPVYMRWIQIMGGFRSIFLGIAIGAAGAAYSKFTAVDHHHDDGEHGSSAPHH